MLYQLSYLASGEKSVASRFCPVAAGKQVAIIGAALDLGAGRRGVDMGPSAIRYAGLHDRLNGIGYVEGACSRARRNLHRRRACGRLDCQNARKR